MIEVTLQKFLCPLLRTQKSLLKFFAFFYLNSLKPSQKPLDKGGAFDSSSYHTTTAMKEMYSMSTLHLCNHSNVDKGICGILSRKKKKSR